MDNLKSSYYQEIFGGDGLDEITPISQKPLPQLPMDDPLHKFDAARTAEIDRLVDAAFVDQLVGNIPDIPRRVPTAATKSDAPYLDNLLQEILPTSDALASFAPTALQEFDD